MASGQVSPKVGKVIDIPANPPTIGTATPGVGSASVAFTAGSTSVGGPVFSYKVLSNPGSVIATGTTSPITVPGLTTDTAYTFTVAGVNPTGSGPYSSASNSATILGTAFESIATVTGTGSSPTISFTSIPGTYKHLQIRANAKSTGSGATYNIAFNSDTTSENYNAHRIMGAAGTVSAAGNIGGRNFFGYYYGDSMDAFTGMIIDIHDYTDTGKYKIARTNAGVQHNLTQAAEHALASILWESTSAITSITLNHNSGNWSSNSTFALYGIK